MIKPIVCIVGCGWLGKELAKNLTSYQTECIGRKTNLQKSSLAIADFIVIAIPPKEGYLKALQNLCTHIQNAKVILISSISYYRGKEAVIKAEKYIKKCRKESVIIRFGGLFGDNRIPSKATQGKTLKGGDTNYIHQIDAVNIIKRSIELNISAKTFDAIAPIQTDKEKLYIKLAEEYSFEPTLFENKAKKLNLCIDRLYKELNYTFVYPDVTKFIYD